MGGTLAALALLWAAGCGETRPPELRIGLVGIYEGTMAGSSGIPAKMGADLAVAEINAAGGVTINGRPHTIVLIERETPPRPDAAASVVQSLINLDSVDAIIGPQTSALAIPAGAVAEAAGVPMIAPMASNAMVTAGRRFVTRLAFVDAFQGAVLAGFAYDSLGIRRAAVLHDAASPYGREISELFASTFTRRGGQIVAMETFDADAPRDHSPQLRRILAGGPEAILLPSFVVYDSAQIRIARSLGFRGRFLGTDSWDLLPMMRRDDALGSVVVANWDRRTQRDAAREFTNLWLDTYGELPRATGAATYDAVHLLALAVHRAGRRSGGAVMDSLRRHGRYEGALTSYEFNGTGDPRRGAVLLEVLRDSTRVRSQAEPRR